MTEQTANASSFVPPWPGFHHLSISRLLSMVPKTAMFDPGTTFLSLISLALPDDAAGLALRERLTRHHVVMTPIMDQGDIWNMGFLDNNGLALEAAWPKHI